GITTPERRESENSTEKRTSFRMEIIEFCDKTDDLCVGLSGEALVPKGLVDLWSGRCTNASAWWPSPDRDWLTYSRCKLRYDRVRFWRKFIEQLPLDEARSAFDSSALSPIMHLAQQRCWCTYLS